MGNEPRPWSILQSCLLRAGPVTVSAKTVENSYDKVGMSALPKTARNNLALDLCHVIDVSAQFFSRPDVVVLIVNRQLDLYRKLHKVLPRAVAVHKQFMQISIQKITSKIVSTRYSKI